MKKNLLYLRRNFTCLYLFTLALLPVLMSNTLNAQPSKYISFTQSSQSADVQQGTTQSLTDFISTSDNNPVGATLTAVDGGGNVPSWLSVNGSLLNGISYTTGAEIDFTFDATNLSVGKYSAVLTASATGYTSAVLDVFLTVTSAASGASTNIKVNFQDSVTVPPVGWLRDYGQGFGLRTSAYQGTGNAYGWIRHSDNTVLDLTKNSRKRTSPPDILQATLMHMQANNVTSSALTRIEGIWECQVANGNYKVTVSAGDGTAVDSRHSINIEGVSAIANFVPTTSNRFISATVTVSVSDGYLSVDADGGSNTKINYIIIQPDTSRRPSVLAVNPQNGSVNVNENSSISTSILRLPNSGVNNNTITTANVFLTEDATGITVPSSVNGTGGGDAITLVPADPLRLSTTYRFTITPGVKDLSDSSFIPYSSTFTTGSSSTSDILGAAFDKVALPNTVGQHSSLTKGPDGKLYALTIDGIIQRYVINADGTLQNPQLIYTLQDEYGSRQQRLAIGLKFDPSSTATNLILWITHSTFVFLNGPDWDGKLSRLTGANLENIQDIIINLPRSKKDHLTNSIAFGPDGALYFTQGCNSAMGRADNTWGNRNEHLLSGACLRFDIKKVSSFPLNAKTADGGGTYSPYAANAPLTLYATGVRNSYDILWHSNGQLYLPTNGSAAGGNTPASVAGTIRPDGSPYNGPAVPALTNVQQTQNDYLFRITQGGYYGHPNPLRGEYVLNGGNPTSPIDPAQVTDYPLGTLHDANYRGYSYNFQANKSPDGVIEYRNNAFNGALKGKIMVVRYSQNNDIIILTPGGANNDIVSSTEGSSVVGLSGFKDPLDLTEDTTNGNLYVSEYGDSGKITLLKPRSTGPMTPTVTFIPTADSYVRNGTYAAINYGSDTSLAIKTSTVSGYSRNSYLKFTLDATSMANIGTIASAKLRVYGRNTESAANIMTSAFGVVNDSWTETGITWNNAPPASATVLNTVAVNDVAKYYDIDVTGYVIQEVAGDRIATFMLRDAATGNKTVTFNSKQNRAFSPQLVITGQQAGRLQHRPVAANSAVITNTNLAFSRAKATQASLPAVRKNPLVKKKPSCDEPADSYATEDTSTVITPVASKPLASADQSLLKNFIKPTVYPNPVQSAFHIKFPASYEGKYRLQLIDIVGRVYELGTSLLQQGGSEITVNVSKMLLPPGLYFLKIHLDNKASDVFKLLIQ